jgi:Tfp pilus assembly protein FimT
MEILFVLVILAILITISFTVFSRLNDRHTLDKSVLLVSSIITEARTNTIAGVDGSAYGVYFQSNQVTLFKGNSYSAGSPDNVVTVLNPRTTISNINLSGGSSSVVFNRLTGTTDEPGTIQFTLISTGQTKLVTISAVGTIQ